MTRPDGIDTIDDPLLRARLLAVCDSAGPMFVLNILATALMAAFYWQPGTAGVLSAWLAVNTIVLCGRGLASHAFQRRWLPVIDDRRWSALLVGITTLVGLSWGIPLAWMIASGTDNQIMLVVCISFGALAMAQANMTFWPIYVAFQVPVTICAAIGFSLSQRGGHTPMAIGAIAIAVAMVTVSYRMAGQVLRAFRLAASNQALVDSLAERGRELERAFVALEQISRTDPLTSLANRRARDERLEREWQRAERLGSLLTVIAVDVDRFKRYNDTHGHEDGDRALQAVGAMLNAATRGALDMAARHGGEEFMLILPGLSIDAAASVAERVRVMIARCQVDFDLPEKVTVSLGVASAHPAAGSDLRGLTAAADEALYRAKLAGRNRYEIAPIVTGQVAVG